LAKEERCEISVFPIAVWLPVQVFRDVTPC